MEHPLSSAVAVLTWIKGHVEVHEMHPGAPGSKNTQTLDTKFNHYRCEMGLNLPMTDKSNRNKYQLVPRNIFTAAAAANDAAANGSTKK
jgi:hypothetical protein